MLELNEEVFTCANDRFANSQSLTGAQLQYQASAASVITQRETGALMR
jgi:hypothetical protein